MQVHLSSELNPRLPMLLRVITSVEWLVLGVTGFGLFLLLAPIASTAFWPWHVDEFHGRMYSAIFLTGAVGAYVLWRSAAAVELLLLGVTQGVLGFFAILGLVIANASRQTVNWTRLGTWVWIGLFGVLMVTGIVMTVLAIGKLLMRQQGRVSWADGSASK